MKLNFNNPNFVQGNFLAQPSKALKHLTVVELRNWWHSLSQEQKKEVCMLDFSDVIRDLTDAANNAFVLCRLNQSYKKKGLMSSEKTQSEDGEVRTFRFHLNDKEILDNDLAQLFSCFKIHIVHKRRSKEGLQAERNYSDTRLKSYVGVNEESLDSILDILANSVSNFGEGDKLLFQDESLLELHNSFQNISSDINLHPYFKKLFERLADFTFLLEQKIYLAYAERKSSQQQQTIPKKEELTNPKVADQLSTLSFLMNGYDHDQGRESAPSLVKTVSQLERECQKQEQSEGQKSTASVSPGNPIIFQSPQNLNLEELEQRLLQNLPIEESSALMTCKTSKARDEIKSKFSEDSVYSDNHNDCPAQLYYEGFTTGNLDIIFDPSDALLIEDNTINSDEGVSESSFYEERATETSENVQQEEPKIYNQRVQKENPTIHLNYNPYYNTSNPAFMDYTSGYPQYQNLSNRDELYSPYHTQQVSMMMPQNYGSPTMYMDQRNVVGMKNPGYDSSRYLGSNYSNSKNQTPRKESFESQSSYGSENLYYSKDKPRYPKKPNLPPRLQRMKENMYRN